MIDLNKKTYLEINNDLAARIVRIRKRRKITQQELARKSGVSYGSIRRFETDGEISLSSLTKLAIALHIDGELDKLFSQVPFESIEEMIREQS